MLSTIHYHINILACEIVGKRGFSDQAGMPKITATNYTLFVVDFQTCWKERKSMFSDSFCQNVSVNIFYIFSFNLVAAIYIIHRKRQSEYKVYLQPKNQVS